MPSGSPQPGLIRPAGQYAGLGHAPALVQLASMWPLMTGGVPLPGSSQHQALHHCQAEPSQGLRAVAALHHSRSHQPAGQQQQATATAALPGAGGEEGTSGPQPAAGPCTATAPPDDAAPGPPPPPSAWARAYSRLHLPELTQVGALLQQQQLQLLP